MNLPSLFFTFLNPLGGSSDSVNLNADGLTVELMTEPDIILQDSSIDIELESDSISVHLEEDIEIELE